MPHDFGAVCKQVLLCDPLASCPSAADQCMSHHARSWHQHPCPYLHRSMLIGPHAGRTHVGCSGGIGHFPVQAHRGKHCCSCYIYCTGCCSCTLQYITSCLQGAAVQCGRSDGSCAAISCNTRVRATGAHYAAGPHHLAVLDAYASVRRSHAQSLPCTALQKRCGEQNVWTLVQSVPDSSHYVMVIVLSLH